MYKNIDEYLENVNLDMIPCIGITHEGKFHADDIFSSALLKILNPAISISRTNRVKKYLKEESLSWDDVIIYDVNRGEFDHHGNEKRYRDNGIEYASFGLLWKHYGPKIFSNRIVEKMDREICQEIDSHDNFQSKNSLSILFSSMNDRTKDNNRDFKSAVDIAVKFLKNYLYKLYREEMEEKKWKAYSTNNNNIIFDNIIILKNYFTWIDDSGKELYVLFNKKGKVHLVRSDKRPLPVEWKRSDGVLEYNNTPGYNNIIFDTVDSAISCILKNTTSI